MASAGTYLNMVYKDAADMSKTIKFNHADPDAEATDIRALNTAILTNKTIWQEQPTTAVKAELVTTSVTEIELE